MNYFTSKKTLKSPFSVKITKSSSLFLVSHPHANKLNTKGNF